MIERICRLPGEDNHPEHVAGYGPLMVRWANVAYAVPTPRLGKVTTTPGRQRQRDGIIAMIERVEPEVRFLDEPHSFVRHGARETEVIAANVSQVRNARRRLQVLWHVATRHPQGITYDQVAVDLADVHMPSPRVASRGGELEGYGWIEVKRNDAGHLLTEITRAGNPAYLWVLTPGGHKLLGEVDFAKVGLPNVV